MPPRFSYWTILVGGLPTAFRAAERAEIEPTFKQLQHKHPDAELRWFARGKLWASPEEARETLERLKAQGRRPNTEGRDRSWRPGGSHRDPRQPYKDAKKRDNQRRRERRFEFKKKGSGLQAPGSRPPAPGSRPHKPWEQRTQKPWAERPKWKGPRPQATGSRSHQEQPKRKRPADAEKPEGERPWTPKPKPWRGPQTDDRRPKTEGGRGPGRTGWGGAARKGPGKGRRK